MSNQCSPQTCTVSCYYILHIPIVFLGSMSVFPFRLNTGMMMPSSSLCCIHMWFVNWFWANTLPKGALERSCKTGGGRRDVLCPSAAFWLLVFFLFLCTALQQCLPPCSSNWTQFAISPTLAEPALLCPSKRHQHQPAPSPQRPVTFPWASMF